MREGEAAFAEPWQASAFALALQLHERGVFSWAEWVAALAVEIQRAQAAGDPDDGSTYYLHWLATLERLVVDRQLVSSGGLADRRAAWGRAAQATPHGQPILLENDPASQ